ncbi:helix-turn-helix transcriptional regulator [Paenibacillus sp. FSL R5-0475]|uniref:helix-turn-helix domain-containing protein n=1 Tax=Paenibacillus sp. FSL R5-0475 TaxID=2921643 RepID=UPI0030FCDEF2
MALSRGECCLRVIRESRGLSQEQLSALVKDKTGLAMSRVAISQFETSKRPMSPEQMRAVCIVLRCTEAELYQWLL